MAVIYVNRDKLTPDKIRAGTKGSYRIESLHFVFSGEWEGLSCKVVFYPSHGKPVEVIYFGNDIDIPPEVMAHSGIAKYVVSGYRLSDGVIYKKIISLTGFIEVDATLGDSGGNSLPMTPGAYEQLRDDMKSDIGEAIQGAIAEGDFQGPPGKSATIKIGTVITTGPGDNASVTNRGTETEAVFDFKIPRGITGETGSPGVMLLGQGETLDDVPEDINIVLIPNGESLEILDGKNFVILGYLDSVDQLNSINSPNQGDAYGIGTESPYDIYVYDQKKGWVNNGSLTGIKGDPGKDGRGIVSIERTAGDGSPGSVDTYTITYTDNTTNTFNVKNGTEITVSNTVTETETNPVSGSAVASYVTTELEKAIGIILSGAS